MRMIISLLITMLAMTFAKAQQVADSFIWPIIGDNTTMVYHNTIDPRLGEVDNLTFSIANQYPEATTPGGWFDIGNPFGNACGESCSGYQLGIYHPATRILAITAIPG